MNWLLWREYGLNRWILVTGGAGLLLPYVIALMLNYSSLQFSGVWVLSTGSAYLTVAMLAGHALAGERANRSAEFIAYLPLGRWRIVASKLLFFLITVAVIFGVTVWGANQSAVPEELEHLVDLRGFLMALLVIYGVGWMSTSFLSSPTYAFLVGLCSLAFVWVGVVAIAIYVGVPLNHLGSKGGHELMIRWSAMTGLPLAIVCYSIGTWNYLRRREH